MKQISRKIMHVELVPTLTLQSQRNFIFTKKSINSPLKIHPEFQFALPHTRHYQPHSKKVPSNPINMSYPFRHTTANYTSSQSQKHIQKDRKESEMRMIREKLCCFPFALLFFSHNTKKFTSHPLHPSPSHSFVSSLIVE